MIKIDLLKNHQKSIEPLAHIYYEVLSKVWMPEITIEEIKSGCYRGLNQDIMPISYVALYNEILVGSATLRLNDGIRRDLKPWLGDLVVDSKYQRQGIGKMLINSVITKAKYLGFVKLYLFSFDSITAKYYEHLGWGEIAKDEYKSRPVIVMEIKI